MHDKSCDTVIMSHDFFNLFLCVQVSIDYLEGQVLAGAQLLQVFESHAGILGPDQFETFCIPYLEKIAKVLKERLKERAVPMVSGCKMS